MVGRKRGAPQRRSQRGARDAGNDDPDIYQDMLAEVGAAAPQQSSPERPLKRRRAGTRLVVKPTELEKAPEPEPAPEPVPQPDSRPEEDSEDEDDMEFQDVVIPVPTMQTIELDSDEDDDDSDEDLQFEDVELNARFTDMGSTTTEEPKELELNLSAQKMANPSTKNTAERRKPITREEKERRIHIHKTHLLCLLSHVARRNHWCNDAKVQDALLPHLSDKIVQYLTPGTNLSQFGRTESLKDGLKQAADVWKKKFEITERGLRRSLWAEDVEHLKDYELPSDMESCLDRDDFRKAASKLQGSRDMGAQLYCALLRSVGVRARLVCSLQPLLFVSGEPTLPRPDAKKKPSTKTSKNEQIMAQLATHRDILEAESSASSSSRFSARRRLGHPNAAAYRFEPVAAPPKPSLTFAAPKRIRESPHPVYWVEILDVGHQKWQPADPVVTHTFWKPKALEPPITDKENCLSYVVAFEADGTAKDVTRRYAKAYTAKTRKLRVGRGPDDGEKWWRKVMRVYRPRQPSDLDQIEDNELIGIETREPMPRNVQDFKDHPIYALERHLRRHEVLAPGAKASGTVSTSSRGPLEKVYRRKDVRVARSADKWFRLGREVKPMETPVKWLPKRVQNKGSRFDDEPEDAGGDAGTPVYTMDQTELYEPPPVRNGRIPKNKFGNIEVYVPSMVPKGGVHVVHEHAARAAFLLGIDYAPALTGFQFKGRHGTATLHGVVVAQECKDAMLAVIDGLGDVEQEMEDERRRLVALKLWRRFLMGLRIRERIWSGVSEEERREADREAELEAELQEVESDATEEFDMVEDDDDDGGGGGFLVE